LDQENVAEEILSNGRRTRHGCYNYEIVVGGLLCLPEYERDESGKDPIASGSIRFVISMKMLLLLFRA